MCCESHVSGLVDHTYDKEEDLPSSKRSNVAFDSESRLGEVLAGDGISGAGSKDEGDKFCTLLALVALSYCTDMAHAHFIIQQSIYLLSTVSVSSPITLQAWGLVIGRCSGRSRTVMGFLRG